MPITSARISQTSSTTTSLTTTLTTISLATTPNKPAVKAHVLMLSTREFSNVPMVIGLDGDVDDHIDFENGVNTEVDTSCGASLHGEMFVIGGYYEKRQISKVQDCKLTRAGDLPFDFYGGGCNTFDFGIMMCFSSSAPYECHSFNGISFKTEPSSKFSHASIYALGSYRNSPFVTGSFYDNNGGLKTEILDYKAQKWTEVKDYPFTRERIYAYATTHTADSVYIIGGKITWGGFRTSSIAKYKNDIWTIAGNLNQAREGHGAIAVNGFVMIIGGYPDSGTTIDTELWDFESTKTEIIKPTLPSYDYAYGMGLFTVEAGFCNKPKTTTTNVYTTTNGFTANVYTNFIILFFVMLFTGSL